MNTEQIQMLIECLEGLRDKLAEAAKDLIERVTKRSNCYWAIYDLNRLLAEIEHEKTHS